MDEALYTFEVLYIVFAVCIVIAWICFLWNHAKDENNNHDTNIKTS
jgi:hypothetical protein